MEQAAPISPCLSKLPLNASCTASKPGAVPPWMLIVPCSRHSDGGRSTSGEANPIEHQRGQPFSEIGVGVVASDDPVKDGADDDVEHDVGIDTASHSTTVAGARDEMGELFPHLVLEAIEDVVAELGIAVKVGEKARKGGPSLRSGVGGEVATNEATKVGVEVAGIFDDCRAGLGEHCFVDQMDFR